ncbi:dephospho-CoA kinase [Pseudofrankia asymbiotica]|uniref:Dephospho-CoA kinase n=1 Tax=Pseudofrankia asymbiotica TaxID=1834516 RepID=A0A1V2IGC6_9ACTN|nr:dephospho-CoA kinase [Pseudofrankia asymbiotica]ONH32040.1 dephospho-CoA kinase [Pseudofrankia asymbiotica]
MGLTGGIGSGKSAVSARLAEHGAVVVDADKLARDVVAPGTPGLAAVAEAFGPGVLLPDGGLDRAALGQIVFADPAARRRLEGITHPLIRDETARRFAAPVPDAIVVHDIPLLVEAGMGEGYDLVVVVEAPRQLRLERLASRGLPRDQAEARMATQADDAARRAVADVLLDNSGDLTGLYAQVDALWHDLVARRDAGPGTDAPL